MLRRGCVALAALALLLPAPATAASAAKQAVVRVVKSYQTALLDGDGKRACSLLTKSAQAKLLAAVPGNARTCPAAADNLAASIDSSSRRYIERARRQLTARDVHIRGRHASAKLLSGRELLLAKVGRRWLISDPSLRG